MVTDSICDLLPSILLEVISLLPMPNFAVERKSVLTALSEYNLTVSVNYRTNSKPSTTLFPSTVMEGHRKEAGESYYDSSWKSGYIEYCTSLHIRIYIRRILVGDTIDLPVPSEIGTIVQPKPMFSSAPAVRQRCRR